MTVVSFHVEVFSGHQLTDTSQMIVYIPLKDMNDDTLFVTHYLEKDYIYKIVSIKDEAQNLLGLIRIKNCFNIS